MEEQNDHKLILDTSYDHKVATIASWIEGEAGNSSSHYTCQPRKIEVPIIRTVECSRNLIESQGCVGVVGSRNVICKVNHEEWFGKSKKIAIYFHYRMMLDQEYFTAHHLVIMK